MTQRFGDAFSNYTGKCRLHCYTQYEVDIKQLTDCNQVSGKARVNRRKKISRIKGWAAPSPGTIYPIVARLSDGLSNAVSPQLPDMNPLKHDHQTPYQIQVN